MYHFELFYLFSNNIICIDYQSRVTLINHYLFHNFKIYDIFIFVYNLTKNRIRDDDELLNLEKFLDETRYGK
jgi:hypothetical protein